MELFHTICLACLAGMSLSLIVTVVLFVRLKIWSVLEYLTGSRAVREIRLLEQKAGDGTGPEQEIPETDRRAVCSGADDESGTVVIFENERKGETHVLES